MEGHTAPVDEGHERLSAPLIDGLQYSNWVRGTLEELRGGSLSVVPVRVSVWDDARAALSLIGEWRRRFDDHSDIMKPIRTASDLDALDRTDTTGIVPGLQNGSLFEDDLDLVYIFPISASASISIRTTSRTSSVSLL